VCSPKTNAYGTNRQQHELLTHKLASFCAAQTIHTWHRPAKEAGLSQAFSLRSHHQSTRTTRHSEPMHSNIQWQAQPGAVAGAADANTSDIIKSSVAIRFTEES
jgi:hypothetical protein